MPNPAPGPQERGHERRSRLRRAARRLLPGYDREDLGEPESARAVIPPGTRVHVGFTGGQDLAGG